MTPNELKAKLASMTDDEVIALRVKFGGPTGKDAKTIREGMVRAFVDHPERELRLCQLLDMPTEEEKSVAAAVSSTESAKSSAGSAKSSSESAKSSSRSLHVSMICAVIAVIISLGALVVSIIALAK